MVDGIGGTSAGRAAFDAALKQMNARKQELGASTAGTGDSSSVDGSSGFAQTLKEGIGAVESQVQRTNEIHVDVLEGRLDLHEVAAQLKESEITFQFALQVRNKLLDAYREVMRMSV